MASLDSSGLSETFDLLTHPHRRYVLYYLTNESHVVGIGTLAAAIDEWDSGYAGTNRATGIDSVEAALHHTHLPKLADAGTIAFGSESNSIVLRDTDGVRRFLTDTAPIDGYAETAVGD